MKVIECKNPESEAHQAAMITAFNSGMTITVDHVGSDFYLLDYENNALAVFTREK